MITFQNRLGTAASAGPRRRRGAGLAEIMLAMIIFAAVATSYAAVTLRFSERMRNLGAGAARTAAMSEYINRLMAVPFDSLANRAGTFNTTTGTFPNRRIISVTGSGTSRTVTLIVIPTDTLRVKIKPDTVVLTRVKASTTSPLGP